MSTKMCNFAYDNSIYNRMKKWQKILNWIMIKLMKPKISMELKTQRACGIYRTTKQYIFLTGYGKTGMGYEMSYPIKFTPIDCDDVEFNNAFGEVFIASNRDKYEELSSAQLIKAMKQRSWRQLHNQSTYILVRQDDAEITVLPAQYKKNEWDYERSLTFDIGKDSIYDIVCEARKLLDNIKIDR